MSDISKSERSARTRESLLAAGLEILREEPAEIVFDRLDARSVVSRTGVTTGAFYHHFDGADGYVEALLQYSLLIGESRPFAVAAPTFEEAVASGADFVTAFVAGAAEMMRFQDRNHTFMLQVAVWARRARSADVTKRLREMYRQVEDETGQYYAQILELLGREMRPPYLIGDLASAFVAVFEGATLRRGVDVDAVPDDRLGRLLLPIIWLMTRPLASEESEAEALDVLGLGWATPG